jgi:hypothetical protein
VEKCGTARQATDDSINRAHALCVRDNVGDTHSLTHTHTLRLHNTYYVSKATVVTRTRLIILYAYRLTCLNFLIPVYGEVRMHSLIQS